MLIDSFRIKNLLADRDMTHRQLSELSGIRLSALDGILAVQYKEVRPSTVNKLCAALKVKSEEISVPPDEYRTNLFCRYATLVEQRHELERKGLTNEASIFQKEIEKIERLLA